VTRAAGVARYRGSFRYRGPAAARGCEMLTQTYKSFTSSLPYNSFIASGSQRTTLPLS